MVFGSERVLVVPTPPPPPPRGGGMDGMPFRPPPVFTVPDAPSPEVLWQTCQVVSDPVLHSGVQGHRRPCVTQ